jgi:hypothetical protein
MQVMVEQMAMAQAVLKRDELMEMQQERPVT